MRMTRPGFLAVAAMTAAFFAAGVLLHVPAGVFGLIGLVGWLIEKPSIQLSERLAGYAAKLWAKIEREKLR
jgi:hypothetical protein